MKKIQMSTEKRVGVTLNILLGLFIILGGYLRFYQLSGLDFPLNDGGLFSQFSDEILDNNFSTPKITEYNRMDIPFAYPPFGFYLVALLMKLSGWTSVRILQYLPAAISTITILAYYYFARNFLKNKIQSIFATLAFALIPQNYIWQIMGGGITRSLGLLFAIIGLTFAFLLFKQLKSKHIILTALFLALTLLSHPDSAVSVLFSYLLLFLFFGRNKQTFIASAKVGFLLIIISSPWWVSQWIVNRFSPLLAASKTGFYTSLFWLQIINFEFTLEFGLRLFAFLGLLGIVYLIIKKDYRLIIWFILMFAVQPRSGARFSIIPFCLMVAYGIDQILLPGIKIIEDSIRGKSQRVGNDEFALLADYFQGPVSRMVFVGIIVLGLFGGVASLNTNLPKSMVLSIQNREAMSWVKQNTERGATFLVISDHTSWGEDFIGEWFPYLADRKNYLTVQGTEWLPDGQFQISWQASEIVKGCIKKDVDCLEKWQIGNQSPVSHIYLVNEIGDEEGKIIYYNSPLGNSLATSANYQEIYRNGEVLIFEYVP